MNLAEKFNRFLNTEPVKIHPETGESIITRKLLINRILTAILTTLAVLSLIYGFIKTKNAGAKAVVLEQSLAVAKIGVWTLDYNTNEVVWNTTMFNIFKTTVTNNGVVDYDFFNSFVAEEDKERVSQEVHSAIRDRKPFVSYFQIVDGNGNPQLIRASGVMLDDHTMQGINILTGVSGYQEIPREKLDEILGRLREPL